MNRCLTLLLLALSLPFTGRSQELDTGSLGESVLPVSFLQSPAKILFLGDSITNHGHYITVLESHFRQAGLTDARMKWINLGLSSETCTGLSEPAHPFPRPNVHERLDRALEKVLPEVVVACYGMNDGIYHPFSKERFEAYQKGITDLVSKAKASGAYTILLTPPPFDPEPMRRQGKLVPESAEDFAWHTIYEGYDSVIARYAAWILEGKDKHQADMVIDVHAPIKAALEAARASDPGFTMSNDGVHMDEKGHQVMADAILKAWQETPTSLDEGILAQVGAKQQLMHAAWLSHVGHQRPGVAPGLPLTEALAKEEAMDAVIDTLTENRKQRERFAKLERKIVALQEDVAMARLRLGNIITKAYFPATERPVALQMGDRLESWHGDTRYWSVEPGGVIRGSNEEPVPSSTYLFTKNDYREFRLIFEVKQTVSPQHSTMHSAVAALGERFEDKGPNPFGFKGPLLMFCQDWGIWDAYRRNRVEPAGQRGTLTIGEEIVGDWNLVEFLVIGNRIRCAANGSVVFDFTDDAEMLQASPIGLQLHSNQRPQEFRFRHLFLSENPSGDLATLGVGSEGLAP